MVISFKGDRLPWILQVSVESSEQEKDVDIVKIATSPNVVGLVSEVGSDRYIELELTDTPASAEVVSILLSTVSTVSIVELVELVEVVEEVEEVEVEDDLSCLLRPLSTLAMSPYS